MQRILSRLAAYFVPVEYQARNSLEEESPAQMALEFAAGQAGLFPQAATGSFDELRAARSATDHQPEVPAREISAAWKRFFTLSQRDGQGDWNQRLKSLQSQIRDNGVSFNVYADPDGPKRPWDLDLFPLILCADDWSKIEAGVMQRMQLLESVLADVYGQQLMLHQGLIDPSIVYANPGYLRAMHGVRSSSGNHLHVCAFDLARDSSGNWRIVAQRTQAPAGLGYLLENRLSISRLFSEAFENMHVQRIGGTYRALLDGMKQQCQEGQNAHIALLSPGPLNPTYFEHAYLARYLGISLVEGNDLIVRDAHLFLKTMRGLVAVHGLLKHLSDEFLDPLELRSDSVLGVPALMQAIRAGNLLVANMPGTAFLESDAMLNAMPALARGVLGQELLLGAPMEGAQSEPFASSQMPTWISTDDGGRYQQRSLKMRVYAIAQGVNTWRVLPGGLARLASSTDPAALPAGERGGSSADVWVITQGDIDKTSLLRPRVDQYNMTSHKWLVTSRSAENLFWLGRYTERAENSVRLARLILECLSGEEHASGSLLEWLSRLAISNTLVLPDVPKLNASAHARRVFERSLLADLSNRQSAASVGHTLSSQRMAGASVRDRLSQEHWNLLLRVENYFHENCVPQNGTEEVSTQRALEVLHQTSEYLAAITGMQTDRMTRDDGWRLLSVGRHLERLEFLSTALSDGFDTHCIHENGGFEAMLSLFDSSITFHAQFQQNRDVAALLHLLMLDRDNPRSLSWVASTLRTRLLKLATPEDAVSLQLQHTMPELEQWNLGQLCTTQDGVQYPVLMQTLKGCASATHRVSDRIGAIYFTHSGEEAKSVGA